MKDVTWLHPAGRELLDHDWREPELRALGMLIAGHAGDGPPERARAPLLLLFNGGEVALDFRLPQAPAARAWELLLDSGEPTRTGELARAALRLDGHSLCLLLARDRAPAEDSA
jgi:glycogen operon protein